MWDKENTRRRLEKHIALCSSSKSMKQTSLFSCNNAVIVKINNMCNVKVVLIDRIPDLTWHPETLAWETGICCGHSGRRNLNCLAVTQWHHEADAQRGWVSVIKPGATVGSSYRVSAGLDPQVCSADRWGSRRWLTGWGWAATWPRGDYKQQEEGKEIRLKTEPAFLTSSLLLH